MKLPSLTAAGFAAAALFAAGGSARPLGFNYASPSWSPDGRELVFLSARGPTGDIILATANGKRIRKLTPAALLSQVVWSPDGRDVTILAPGADPAWAPDGKRVAFSARRLCRTSGIFTIDADGKRLARLTPCR